MKKIALPILLFCFYISNAQSHITLFEKSKGTQTPVYADIIKWWQQLDKDYKIVKMQAYGQTDAGFPLHLVTVSGDQDFNFSSLHHKNKNIIFINNGIHPGEPDGIDASMLLVRDIVTGKIKLPFNIVLAIIPVYNIGGALNRSENYRVDQNGPEAFGFRGNGQNLDLNRDFIKCDSKNARTFTALFHMIDPDVFLDNHVSDGADYQHIMTLIASQHDKLGGVMGEFMNKNFEPGMYDLMKKKGYDLIPYVNSFGDTPENGWPEFWDSPRYSSGYASLWHTFGFISETHMLKAYDKRVMSTYALMQSFIEFTSKNGAAISTLRDKTKQAITKQQEFALSWKSDTTRHSDRTYKGFTAGHKPSEVSGQPRLFYDRSKPYEIKVPFYNFYIPERKIQKPTAYIIPQGWWKVTDLLTLNGVKMLPLKKDTSIEVEVYRIEKYQAGTRVYEGHHPE